MKNVFTSATKIELNFSNKKGVKNCTVYKEKLY